MNANSSTTSGAPSVLDVLQKDITQALASFTHRIEALRESTQASAAKLMPVKPCVVPEHFRIKPEVDTSSPMSWAEQVLSLRASLRDARDKVIAQHEQNRDALADNLKVKDSIIDLMAKAGFPVLGKESSMGIYSDLKQFCVINDNFEKCITALAEYEGQLAELRSSTHSIGVEVDTVPAFNAPLEANPALRTSPPPVQPPAPAQRVTSFPSSGGFSTQVAGGPGSALPLPTKSASIRQPQTQPPAPVQAVRVPVWPSPPQKIGHSTAGTSRLTPKTGETNTAQEHPKQGERQEPSFETNRVESHTESKPKTEFSDQSHLAQNAPSVFRTQRQAASSSPSAPGLTQSPAKFKATEALNRLQRQYGAKHASVASVLSAMSEKHKYVEIAAWLSFCCEGHKNYFPKMQDALERFTPKTNQDFAILEELKTALNVSLNENRNGFTEMPFTPKLVEELVPRVAQTDLREIAPLLIA